MSIESITITITFLSYNLPSSLLTALTQPWLDANQSTRLSERGNKKQEKQRTTTKRSFSSRKRKIGKEKAKRGKKPPFPSPPGSSLVINNTWRYLERDECKNPSKNPIFVRRDRFRKIRAFCVSNDGRKKLNTTGFLRRFWSWNWKKLGLNERSEVSRVGLKRFGEDFEVFVSVCGANRWRLVDRSAIFALVEDLSWNAVL